MKKIDAILLMAGTGSRTLLPYNKAIYSINQIPLYMYSLIKFNQVPEIENIYLVVNENDYDVVLNEVSQNYPSTFVVIGGQTRSESVKCALKRLSKNNDVIIHDCARPLVSVEDIKTLIQTSNFIGTLYHKSFDTVKEVSTSVRTLNRDNLFMITTPQYFNKELINEILANDVSYTDELQLFENKYDCNFVEETTLNLKFTSITDLDFITYKLSSKNLLFGHSYDFHPFKKGRKLILGGVEIEHDFGLLGHSDADALYHAVTESIIGALNLGDIGTLFPDDSALYKGMDSSYFLKEVMKLVDERNLVVRCVDAIIYIEKPKLKNYKNKMALNIKALTNALYVNVKATTMEKCGLVGEELGIGCEAVCLLTDKSE